MSCTGIHNYFLEMIGRFSSLLILKCVVAWILRFIRNVKSQIHEHVYLHSDDLRSNEMGGTPSSLVKITQVYNFLK